MLLSENNIKAELSYCYLHAIAAMSGMGCRQGDRHEDGMGVDATLRIKERFGSDSILTRFTVDVQLKATAVQPKEVDGKWSFPLRLKNYDDLRVTDCDAPQLLVVLFLPVEQGRWLAHSAERLVFQRCAYWVSLRNAPESENDTQQTVYLPTDNHLSVPKLREVVARFSRREVIDYEA